MSSQLEQLEEQAFRMPPADSGIPAAALVHIPEKMPPSDFEASVDETEQCFQDWRATFKRGAVPSEQFFRDIRHEPVKQVQPGMKKIRFG
jgi:hypothetical protein